MLYIKLLMQVVQHLGIFLKISLNVHRRKGFGLCKT